MKLEEIIKTYGKNDYYEMNTGRTFLLSQMEYHLFNNVTTVPVIGCDGKSLGNINLKGDWTNEVMA